MGIGRVRSRAERGGERLIDCMPCINEQPVNFSSLGDNKLCFFTAVNPRCYRSSHNGTCGVPLEPRFQVPSFVPPMTFTLSSANNALKNGRKRAFCVRFVALTRGKSSGVC